MLYTSPSGAVQVLFIWVGVLGCTLLPKNRTAVVLALIIPPLIGNILLLKFSLSAGWGLVVASWLVSKYFSVSNKKYNNINAEQSSCITSVMSILLSLSASNVKGNTKRAVVNAMFFIGYCTGCIGAPQLWTHKPRYLEGVVTAIVTWCLLAVVVVIWWGICWRENQKRGAKGFDDGERDAELIREGKDLDVTEREDRSFRYTW